MKRFYCTICKRVKRVRSYPTNIQNVTAEQPQERIGSCSRHELEYKPVVRTNRRTA